MSRRSSIRGSEKNVVVSVKSGGVTKASSTRLRSIHPVFEAQRITVPVPEAPPNIFKRIWRYFYPEEQSPAGLDPMFMRTSVSEPPAAINNTSSADQRHPTTRT
uniref:Uncharacterized protein n=1 Tax=Talaromyces marneffei PM1 TaxID=1077442 RepID=A0A093UP93_TALMA